jgi:hypothetical protein
MEDDPFAVLGVSPDASEEEQKRAYRRALRHAHPDQGGSTEKFARVQAAWAAKDVPKPKPTGSSRVPRSTSPSSWMAEAPTPRSRSGVGAKSHGHPGGWFREKYGTDIREWLGRGEQPANIFDPALVARVPAPIRHTLHAAIAEEETAKVLASLGSSFEIWHDVVVKGSRDTLVTKIDHVVLGPSLLWALQSEDWGAAVHVAHGELVSEGMAPKERPGKDLAQMVKALSRSLGVRFSAMAYVLPDAHLEGSLEAVTTKGKIPMSAVRLSALPDLLAIDAPRSRSSLVGDDIFPLRERLRQGISFV